MRLAEDLGYDSAWIAEGHGGDQFSILSGCAAATSRIKLGTAISSIFVRSAPTLAMAAATVDELSEGRLILGLGSSHKVQVVPEHGIEYNKPILRLTETVKIIKELKLDLWNLMVRLLKSKNLIYGSNPAAANTDLLGRFISKNGHDVR